MNRTPHTGAQIISLGTENLAGLNTYESSLNLTQVTSAGFEPKLTAFTATDADYNAARTARQAASDIFQTAMEELQTWLFAGRNILASRLGNRWSTKWVDPGFIDNSAAIPRNPQDQLALALRIANYLNADPTRQVAALEFTSAKAIALRSAGLAADQALAAATVDLKQKQIANEAAEKALTTDMRLLINILAGVLGKADPRWLAFGLNMPGAKATPAKPENLRAFLGDAGEITVECDRPALATRFRWRMRLVGVETEFRLVARSKDPMAAIKGVQAGQTAEIIVQAVNGSSQSVASEPVFFTVPMALTAATTVAAPVAPAAKPEPQTATEAPVLEGILASTESNGHRNNGHTNGSRLPALA